jgi:hypothetical protein
MNKCPNCGCREIATKVRGDEILTICKHCSTVRFKRFFVENNPLQYDM